jgi:hypothetical protein
MRPISCSRHKTLASQDILIMFLALKVRGLYLKAVQVWAFRLLRAWLSNPLNTCHHALQHDILRIRSYRIVSHMRFCFLILKNDYNSVKTALLIQILTLLFFQEFLVIKEWTLVLLVDAVYFIKYFYLPLSST